MRRVYHTGECDDVVMCSSCADIEREKRLMSHQDREKSKRIRETIESLPHIESLPAPHPSRSASGERDSDNIFSEVRRLQEIRLRSAVTQEPDVAFSADDMKFVLSLIDQRDRAFKELIRQQPAAPGSERLRELIDAAQWVIEWEQDYRTRNNLGKNPPMVFIHLAKVRGALLNEEKRT